MIILNKLQSTHEGLTFRNNKISVLFGNKHRQLLPSYKYVQQVHGKRHIQVSEAEQNTDDVEADALVTDLADITLAIKTADCIPLLAYNSREGRIAAIHAGWRGLAQLIIFEALQQNLMLNEHTQIFLGPHILWNSFETGVEVLESFKQSGFYSSHQIDEACGIHKDSQKIYLNLQQLALWQCQDVPLKNIACSNIDTLTSLQWHSYRRDGKQTGRNISTIKLLN